MASSRVVVQADASSWLTDNDAEPGDAIITSLPDVSELPALGPGLDGWKSWFMRAAAQVMRWPLRSSGCVFFQSDVRHLGTWVDKSYLVQRAAEGIGASLLFHRIVCRKPPGTLSQGRASYSHLLGFTLGAVPAPKRPLADVLPDPGHMPWSRAMGTAACDAACRYLVEELGAKRIVDPYCGRGTVLAVANELGIDSLGVELSAKRCRAARKLSVAALETEALL